MNLAQQYIEDVQSGAIITNRYIRLAVQRHLDLLEVAEERGYFFDEEAGQYAIDIISILKHTNGKEFAGLLFQLQGWQAFLLWVIFGWKVAKTNNRLINKAYIEIAKKNGKTELAAAIAVLMAFFDGEIGAEVYIGATKRAQSDICFRAIRTMINYLRQDSEWAAKAIAEPQRWNVHSLALNAKIEPLARDAKGDQGINAHCGIIDEYHVHADTDVHDNIESSMVARSQPLDFIITTAGMNIESHCYRLRKTATDILEGIKEDDRFFTMIFCFDEGDDWEDQTLWCKPIPNLDVSVRLENIVSQYTKAKNEGSAKLRSFKTLNLNMWQASNHDSWVSDTEWQACTATYTPEELRGRQCFGGLDMAATSDIAATCLFFPARDDTEKHRLIWNYYLPAEGIHEKETQDKVRYTDWANEGWFTLIPSNVILSEAGRTAMKKDIMQQFQHYQVTSYGFDRWNAFGLVSDLVEDGLSSEILTPFGMGYKSMSTPMNFLGSWIKQQEIEHLADPVIRWMVSNCIVATDGENIKPDRRKSINKIDGLVAAIIAVGQYFIWASERQSQRSIYDNDELWED